MKELVNGKDLAAMKRREEQCFDILLAAPRIVSGLAVLVKGIVGLGRRGG